MSHSMHRGASSVPPPSTGFGMTFLIGGSIVAAGFTAAWMALSKSSERKQRRGVNPIYEQLIAHVGYSKGSDSRMMPAIRAPQSVLPSPPVRDHNPKMMSLPKFYNSDEYSNSGHQARYSSPSPQRSKDREGKEIIGATPEYVKNYGKTDRAIEAAKLRAATRQTVQA